MAADPTTVNFSLSVDTAKFAKAVAAMTTAQQMELLARLDAGDIGVRLVDKSPPNQLTEITLELELTDS